MKPIVLNDSLAREIHLGIESTFANMFGLKTNPGAHTILNDSFIDGDVTGIINLNQDVESEEADGALVLSFPAATIYAMLAKIYNKPFTTVDKSVKSGVGELTNVVFGVLKANLNRAGFNFQRALPNVICGDGHSVYVSQPGKTLVIPFTCESGNFTVSVITSQNMAFNRAG